MEKVDLFPFGGDVEITEPDDFIGRWVTFMLTSGIVVAGVFIDDVESFDGALRLKYRLSGSAAQSAVSFKSIAYLYVHYHTGEIVTAPTIHFGQAAPYGNVN